jgi:hypothetical protein
LGVIPGLPLGITPNQNALFLHLSGRALRALGDASNPRIKGKLVMPGSIGLSPEEVYELTHYKQLKKQCEALADMCIPFSVRPDGTPFVAREILLPKGGRIPNPSTNWLKASLPTGNKARKFK